MEIITDWLKLWEQLIKLHLKSKGKRKERQNKYQSKHEARNFDNSVRKKWRHPDSSRNYIKSVLKKNPGSTLLDIGAGSGSWSIYLSPYALKITALDPSDAMIAIMKERITGKNITNIKIVKGSWPESYVTYHDYLLASHSFYGIKDFSACIRKMNQIAGKACFLVLRVPLLDAPMAKAAEHILGQPYDSPNFQIAYNALLQMGMYPNVLMETGGEMHIWKHDTFEEALMEIKQRLCIAGNAKYDSYLKKLLRNNLTKKDGKYIWPAGVRSALVYWDV